MANYRIRSGDTLSELAQRFNTTVARLARDNNISNPNVIRAGATIQVPGGGGGGGKPKRKRGLNRKQIDEIEEEYGLSYAMFKAFPELNRLLQNAVKENWTPGKFQVELRQSDWFKRHSDTWRKNTALKHADPATYRERLHNNITLVQNLANSVGARVSKKGIRSLAERGLLFGYDEGQLRDQLAKHVKPSRAGVYGGEMAGIEDALSQIAYQNGIRIGPKSMRNYMQQIVRGNATQETYESHIRNVAASTFSLYGDQIRNGMNLMDVASPYVEAMAGTLELNPGDLDLFDPTIRRALSGVRDEKTKERIPLSVTDFEDRLRTDRRWQYTTQAQTQAKGYVSAISKMWGLS